MASTDSAAATPTGTPAPTPRYVPGAPPPAPPSKSKKKKAKSALKNLAAAAHEAALSDHAPDAEDVKAGKVDPSLLANPPPPSSGGQDTGNNTDADEAKAPEDKSVVAESIAKRVRALGKKAQRLQEYKNQKEELNPDQKAALEGLPLLESNIKELEGIKKTVETLEAGQRRALAQQRNEERKAAERRVTEATQHAEASLLPRITSLLSFLALRNLLVHATPSDISISDTERNAIISAGDALLAHPPVGHVEEIVKGFLTGAGSWEDIEYSRLLEITAQFAAPRAATPIPDPSIPLDPTTTAHPVDAEPEAEEPEAEAEPEVEPEAEIEQPEEAPEAEQPVVLAFGQPPATGGGFHFMQESELDVPATMTESQEWVSVQQHEGAQEEEEEEVAPEEDVGYVGTEEGAAAGADAASGAPLDWAGDEEHDLPDLGGLQATFGGSGSATPIAPQVTSTGAPTTGKSVTIDDDGFTAIPSRRGGHGQRGSYGGRGRGGPRGEGYRGRGGFRGEGGEGGYRGRGRGSWQGGEGGEGGEGGYRGRGGYRGGEGGEGGYRGRGGYRGEGGEGGEGGYRGRGRGSWQGGEGGEGGEGGYRGRGGYRSGEGGEGGYRGRGGYRNEGGEGEGGYRGRGRGSWGGEGGEGRGGRGGYRGDRRGGSGFRGGRGGSGGATPTAEAPGAA